jgi:uncharacterized protein YjbJ (UPF0337 family)
MHAQELKGKGKQLTGEAKRRWGRLTDDDLTAVAGDRDKLVGKIQERHGKSKDEAEREVNDWIEKQ